MNPIEQFRDAIRSAGLQPPDEIDADGKLRRFASNGKRGDDAGWYVLHNDGIPAGSFGDWRTDFTQTWRADIGRTLTAGEEAAHCAKVEIMRRERDADLSREHAEAAKKAETIWQAALPNPNHPYLTVKGIKANGVKLYKDALLIPMRDADGVLHSLQFIGANGGKKFLSGGRVAGCYYSIGTLKDATALCITEGFATGATIHEATGLPVAVAFNAGNLLAVAREMRKKFPDLILIFCADDDCQTTGNPGLTKATEAAQSVGGYITSPVFDANRPDKATDFNDMAALTGLDEVKQTIAAAKAVVQNSDLAGRDLSHLNKGGDTNTLTAPPEPLPTLPDVLPFDYSYLPDTLRGYVQDISERMQCPPDFAAVGVLVMAATIIGRKVGVRPMKHNDWTVIPNLWGAVVGNSGVMKSPTLAGAMSPIKRLQAKAYEAYNKAKSEHDAQAELASLQRSVNKTKARQSLKKDQSADVKGLLQSGETDDAPILKRYLTNNASYEALGELLMENPNGLLMESDEIIGLLKQLDAGGQEVARSFYLTAADGDKPYTFDRIMRGKGLHIDALCLSIIGGIQPGVLAEYVRQATGGGAGADGLLQRFGLMVYPDISPDWKEVDRYPDSFLRERVNLLVERLDNLNPEAIGAEVDQYGGVPFLRFDDAAQVLFSEWRATLELRLRSGEEHPAIVSHLSKYRKLIPSLALINHLCDSGHGAVNESALLRAIAFSEYLESHAQRIYSYATRPDIDAAKTLLKRLARGKLSNPFKARDLSQKGWAGLETTNKAHAAIELLIEYQHLSAEEKDTGGRPTKYYHWIKGAL